MIKSSSSSRAEARPEKRHCSPPAGRASARELDRKSTRLNSSHLQISYAVFCLKKKKKVVSAGRSSLLRKSEHALARRGEAVFFSTISTRLYSAVHQAHLPLAQAQTSITSLSAF